MKKHGSIKQAIVLAAVSLLFFACIAGFYICLLYTSIIRLLFAYVNNYAVRICLAIIL